MKNPKPSLEKLDNNKIRINPSKEEKNQAVLTLKSIKSVPHKIVMLPKGYSTEWEKVKREIQERKLKNEFD